MTDAPGRGPYAKSAARRSEIITTATAVFGTHGYRGGSLRQIAKQLDLGLTTVMHHFPTKVSLLAAVLSQEDAADTDFLDRSARDGFIPTVLAIVERNIGRRELVRMFTVVQAEATHADHEAHAWLQERYASVIPDYRDAIEHDRSLGRLATTRDATMLADLVIGTWEGIQVRWLADGTDPVDGMRVALEALLEPIRR
ncbi:TetR/AcrR family transcriptional regulator [Microbacterium oleivorans]|uniref:Putative transcriptional regulator n=1 Tax=Microbacterium oleivorans TaxID=273677 RepID=A0A031FU91_9MICO|nr:TetR/AcrR family transcriptional regulator [Microbacterium oleivorans]EZP27872.1 putative transcriptional regulator [Microbacterium oleivorans]THE07847.1 TetR/AcrR family transcriptional regulator [Microbacterium oleivorans]